MKRKEFCVEFWGDFACFTNPLHKVDRVSYPCLTPGAAKAMIGAIFDKPAIENVITKIEIMNPISWYNMTTNELDKVSNRDGSPTIINDNRTQRKNRILQDVRYRVFFRQEFIPVEERGEQKRESGSDETPEKYIEIFKRRISKGQCFKQPVFGLSAYPSNFRLIDTDNDIDKPVEYNENIGIMYYGMDYNTNQRQWFNAEIKNGTLYTDPEKIDILKV